MSLLKMEIENLAFLVDRLGEDCSPLQFLRELTHNSIQAIQRTPEKTGTVVWHVEEVDGVPKLAITDTGDGMTEGESAPLIEYLCRHATRPENVYRHRWRVGDLLCWDNRTTMHRALGDFDPLEPRHMLRATLRGEKSGIVVAPPGG